MRGSSWGGGQLADQMGDPRLQLRRGLLERRVGLRVTRTLRGGVGHAPVAGRGLVRELGADLSDLVAERDDVVEAAAGVSPEMLGGVAGDVDATLGHHLYRVGMQRL